MKFDWWYFVENVFLVFFLQICLQSLKKLSLFLLIKRIKTLKKIFNVFSLKKWIKSFEDRHGITKEDCRLNLMLFIR